MYGTHTHMHTHIHIHTAHIHLFSHDPCWLMFHLLILSLPFSLLSPLPLSCPGDNVKGDASSWYVLDVSSRDFQDPEVMAEFEMVKGTRMLCVRRLCVCVSLFLPVSLFLTSCVC